MFLPSYFNKHPLHPRNEREHRRAWQRWRQARACHEWKYYVDRKLPCYSADGYKDIPRRNKSLHKYGLEQARKSGYKDAISQKIASLRKRWRLKPYRDIRGRWHRTPLKDTTQTTLTDPSSNQ